MLGSLDGLRDELSAIANSPYFGGVLREYEVVEQLVAWVRKAFKVSESDGVQYHIHLARDAGTTCKDLELCHLPPTPLPRPAPMSYAIVS